MNTIINFNDFINESYNDAISDKLKNSINVYRFDNKIKQDKSALVKNAINIKEVIHTACKWCLDESAHIFLFEIAMIETGLGTSKKSRATRGDIGRGIWHVDKGTFEWTKKPHPRINNALNNMKKIGLDWTKLDWNDVSNNILLGAIAAKLTLLKKGINYSNSQNLNSVDKRAKIYAVKYNGGGTAEAETNYKKNTISWYKEMKKHGAEYLIFRGKKYNITEEGLEA
jgi:hypothetical protein